MGRCRLVQIPRTFAGKAEIEIGICSKSGGWYRRGGDEYLGCEILALWYWKYCVWLREIVGAYWFSSDSFLSTWKGRDGGGDGKGVRSDGVFAHVAQDMLQCNVGIGMNILDNNWITEPNQIKFKIRFRLGTKKFGFG